MPDSHDNQLSLHVGNVSQIQYISTERIRVLNPRTRNQKLFKELVDNIASVGIKRPVTVCLSGEDDQGQKYNLVCGQGRFEALMALGESEVPCIVVEASEADGYLISLVENLARRKHTNKELLNGISILSDRGYNCRQIADKTALDPAYISGVLLLLRQGEDRLISGVEKGWLPMTIAIEISRSSDADIQLALTDAYEAGTLKGEQMISTRRLIDKRRSLGKTFKVGVVRPVTKATTARNILSTYQNEVRRQQHMIKRANVSEHRLMFITSALRNLFRDSHFCTLLRAEGILDMPKPLGDKIHGGT
jgi:ParB family chromosome partitioning protein